MRRHAAHHSFRLDPFFYSVETVNEEAHHFFCWSIMRVQHPLWCWSSFPWGPILSPWLGDEVGYDIGTCRPTYVPTVAWGTSATTWRHNRLFIPWSGTKNTATVQADRRGEAPQKRRQPKNTESRPISLYEVNPLIQLPFARICDFVT